MSPFTLRVLEIELRSLGLVSVHLTGPVSGLLSLAKHAYFHVPVSVNICAQLEAFEDYKSL